MLPIQSPLLYALGSNLSFAFASTIYADFAKKVSPIWMNFHKSLVAWICFLTVASVLSLYIPLSTFSLVAFFLSGFLGLFIGDTFLLKAFAELGSGRTLMVFGFQPLILGASSYFLFDERISPIKFLAILFLVGCVFSFSLESSKLKGHWGVQGLLFAFAGVLLDAAGLLLTRYGFNENAGISPFYVNVIRTSGAIFGFACLFQLQRISKFNFQFSPFKPFFALTTKDRWIASLAGALGTFISLSFYLHAVQIGNLASVSAVAGTSPVLATLIETARGRRPLTPHLLAGATLFLIGFLILTLA